MRARASTHCGLGGRQGMRLQRGFWCVFVLAVLPVRGQDSMPLSGFSPSPHFDEQIRESTFAPEVLVRINAPGPAHFDRRLPIRLVVFALPNGNTIPQTVGRRMEPGLDWHFDIQHIGAQTRLVRQHVDDCNLIVAYVQAEGRSWPGWRRAGAERDARIVALIDHLRSSFAGMAVTVELTAHSGGGSFIFGFIEQLDAIPPWVTRIVWLDANYNFDAARHGRKLKDWLAADSQHALGVFAYDDREVRFRGKPIVSPTGGTFRRTRDMQACLAERFTLAETETPILLRARDASGRIELVRIKNPERRILHTVLVERNGFVHGLTLGTPLAGRVAPFWGPRAYAAYIQPN
jgi:hypothetical protein